MKADIRQRLLASTLLFGALAYAGPAVAQNAPPPAPLPQNPTEADGSRTDSEAAGAQVPVESGVEPTSAEQPSGEIVVTGSRISRPDLEASSPVTVITGEALEISGTTSVEEYLSEIPQAVAAIGGNTNNGNPGVATVDLRNLSEERTLVLVDGKRFIPYDSGGIVDLNMIPASLVERVDVLTGGASSVYGSDAIAGVVNFILRKDFSGFEFDNQLGITQRGDGFTRSHSLTVGANSGDGRGNLVVNATYIKEDPVYQGARGYSRNVLAAADLGAGGNSFTNAGGTFLGLVSPTCAGFDGICTFDANNNLVEYDDAFGFNFNPFNLLQAPQEKWTATAIGRYDITDNIEFFARTSFANTRVTTIIAPTGTFFFPFDINLDNPNLTPESRAVLAANDTAAAGDPNPGDGIVTLSFGRRLTELGTRDSIYENTAYQLVGGFTGDIVDGLGYELFGQWGRTSRTITNANDFSYSAAQECLLDASCNFFGVGGLDLPAQNFIRLDLQQIDATTQTIVGGFLNYDLPFVLGGTKSGGVVAGAEFRREAGTARPDQNLIEGNAPGFGSSTPINALIEVKEVYAEAKVPIFDMASIEGGIRRSDYENRDNLTGQGNTFTSNSYKLGGDIEPINDLRFRAVWARAVRAPNLSEIGQPLTPSTGDLQVDPCSSSQLSPAAYAAATPGSLAALCVATGVPLAAGLAGIVSSPVSGQINNFLGGNIDLTPEKSTTKTFGVVFGPRFISGFTAAIDYFDIDVKNAIVTPTESATVTACYSGEQDPAGPNCQRILRNPLNGSLSGGTETGVISTVTNIGSLQARGIDFNLNYRTAPLFAGARLALALNATRTLRSRVDDVECLGLIGDTCLRTQPKWQWNQTTTMFAGPLTLQLRWRHIGKVTKDDIVLDGTDPSEYAVPTIKAHNYFDLFSKVDVGDHYEFRFGINNLLDKQPPVVGNDYGGTTENSGNTFPATYDPLGRSFFAGVNLRF